MDSIQQTQSENGRSLWTRFGARRFWSGRKQALIIVSPETVVRWHRAGFRLYWRAIYRARRVIGRKRISKEVRDLIFRMAAENPTWGAPRDPEPAKRWLAFLKNHREAIAGGWPLLCGALKIERPL